MNHAWLLLRLSHHSRLLHPWNHDRLPEHIDHVGVVHSIDEVAHLQLTEALSFQVVLRGVEVKSHLLRLLQELLLLVLEELWDHALLVCRWPQ